MSAEKSDDIGHCVVLVQVKTNSIDNQPTMFEYNWLHVSRGKPKSRQKQFAIIQPSTT